MVDETLAEDRCAAFWWERRDRQLRTLLLSSDNAASVIDVMRHWSSANAAVSFPFPSDLRLLAAHGGALLRPHPGLRSEMTARL